MQNNRIISISSGGSRKATVWPQQKLYWSEFLAKLNTPARSPEPLDEYMKYSKSKQDELKDVGGFVGGTLRESRRKASNVESRDLITLDLDNIKPGMTKDILTRISSLKVAYAVYSTRKHAEYAPRLRVILPTDRTMQCEEYEPIARKVAERIGIALCDPTTFEPSRLMYWPSCSIDSDYVFKFEDNPFLSADGILSMYENWTDITSWPQVPGTEVRERQLLARQEDPTAKAGIVGAFCKAYDIESAIAKFIPGVYEECDINGRWTYIGGSTTGGAVLYEDGKFLYSHHATDPSSGKLCNAFDLIRIHKYGHLDDSVKDGTPPGKLPSYSAMKSMALSDSLVSSLMHKENLEKLAETFPEIPAVVEDDPEEFKWVEKLSKNQNGCIERTIDNIVIILNNEKSIKGKIALDEFANKGMALGALPWDRSSGKRIWKDVDDAELYRYLEKGFGITGTDKVEKALLIVANNNRINDVKQYLTGVKWDNINRLDTVLVDYLGAEDNIYTRAVTRKSLVAAVARVMSPGIKYDNMPVLIGPQGIGKSTFLAALGKDWFSDSLTNFEGKDAAEMIQGVWINEVGELTAMKKSEENSVKQFLSKREDIYRKAYGKNTEKYPRKCVFFGTSNNYEFLRDVTGNRRFWPVDLAVQEPIKSVFEDLEDEVDQIWAEAYMRWTLGEPLYLSGAEKEMAIKQQEAHMEVNVKEGLITEFVNKKVPADWLKKDLATRRLFWSGSMIVDESSLFERDRICALEVWCECLNGDPKYIRKSDTIEINAILAKMEGWETIKTPRVFGIYGNQRGHFKIRETVANISDINDYRR